MKKYLKAESTARPELFTPETKIQEGVITGELALPTTGGSLALRPITIPKRGKTMRHAPVTEKITRLSWPDNEGSLTMQVPVGEYRITNLQYNKMDEDGRLCNLSASNKAGCGTLTVTQEETAVFDIPVEVHVKVNARVKKQKLIIGLAINTVNQKRITISREQELSPASYEVVDAQGQVVHTGSLQYG